MCDEFGDMRPKESESDYVKRLARKDLEAARKYNNPNREPTGDFTGRCSNCGSKDLWTDNLTYGCNTCGALFVRN